MKQLVIVTLLMCILLIKNGFGQVNNSFGSLPPFTKWYQNPLGVSPIALHTGNGIILPAIAATAILIFTKKDNALTNRISYYDDFGVSYGYYADKTTVYQNNLGVLYQMRKYMSVGAEFSTVYVIDDKNNTWGLGLRPFVRFYPIHRENFKLFFQSGAGLILFADTYPKPSGFFGDNREGTRLNGSPKYGIGTEFLLSKHLSAQIGLWHVHFSNGNHPSADRNPGHDSNGFSIGLVYKPKGKY
ncbi:acyloxyacyl hydrolase [Thermoflexibacter ruber]|uniref:Opacity protein n=1 Tax=Thermoflexibacter ruber TaxID=1003 RepID=A0A1I2GXP3_9BACT|nr:acyloxyacyl hydrolase [Thermoflexibacter ruber]SFF21923.1 Opacity protein [Thermoflexibacter ruber]